MVKTLTVSELSLILGVSVNTTWKKIKKQGLRTGKELVNNREITVVKLTQEEINELIGKSEDNKGVNNINNPNDYIVHESDEHVYEGVISSKNEAQNSEQMQSFTNVDMTSLMTQVMDYSKDMNNQLKEYVDRIIDAEKQVKLLEDLEKQKDDKYYELRAENTELKNKVKALEAENTELKNKVKALEAENTHLKQQLESKKSPFSWLKK